jgi:hypothetical protein
MGWSCYLSTYFCGQGNNKCIVFYDLSMLMATKISVELYSTHPTVYVVVNAWLL